MQTAGIDKSSPTPTRHKGIHREKNRRKEGKKKISFDTNKYEHEINKKWFGSPERKSIDIIRRNGSARIVLSLLSLAVRCASTLRRGLGILLW